MKTYTINGEARPKTGSADSNRLRRNGKIPCTLHDHGKSMHFAAEEKNFRPIISKPDAAFIDIDFGKEKIRSVIHDTQFDPVTDRLIHIDLLKVSENKPITVSVPVATKGRSLGEVAGAKVFILARKLRIQALTQDIPDKIEIDVSNLDIADAVKVKDISVKGVKFLDRPSTAVVSVSFVKYEEPATTAAPATEISAEVPTTEQAAPEAGAAEGESVPSTRGEKGGKAEKKTEKTAPAAEKTEKSEKAEKK